MWLGGPGTAAPLPAQAELDRTGVLPDDLSFETLCSFFRTVRKATKEVKGVRREELLR